MNLASALVLIAVVSLACTHAREASYRATYTSPDGSSVARIDARRVSIDGRPSRHAFGGIGSDGVVFSPDGRHSAYVGLRRGRAHLVVDDQIVAGPYEGYAPKTLALGADGRTSFFVARKGEDWIPIVDGKEIGTFSDLQLGSPKLSANGKRLAFGVRRDSKWMVVDGTRVGPEVDGLLLGTPTLSSDGSHLAYGAERGGRWTMMVDDRPGPEFDELLPGGPIFSSDGSRMVYAARRGGRWFVVENDVLGPAFDEVRLSPAGMSARGERFAYAGRRGDDWQVVDGDHESSAFEAVLGGTPIVSRDGQRLVYGVKRGDRWEIVDGASDHPTWDEIAPNMPFFTPKSDFLVYMAREGSAWHLVENGHRTPTYDGILAPGFITSRDGMRLAYVRLRGDEYSAVVDGVENRFYQKIGFRSSRFTGFDSVASTVFSLTLMVVAPIPYMATQSEFVDLGPLHTVVFSPDGSRYAYLADRGTGPLLVVDGVEQTSIPRNRKVNGFEFVDRNVVSLDIAGQKRPYIVKIPATPTSGPARATADESQRPARTDAEIRPAVEAQPAK